MKTKAASKNKENWYVADFETVTMDTEYFKKTGDTKVLLFCLMKWTDEQTVLGVSIDEFFSYLLNKDESSTVFFHNLNFDGDFIVKWLTAHDFKYIFNPKPDTRTKGFSILRNAAKIYEIRVFFRGRVSRCQRYLIFRCSLKLLSDSVANLGKALGLNKFTKNQEHDFAFYDIEPKEKLYQYPNDFKEYCINDCRIVLRSLKALEETINSLPSMVKNNILCKYDFNIFNYLTVASLSYALMCKYAYVYNIKKKDLVISSEDRSYVRKFFAGGLTQFNELLQGKSEELTNIYYIDRNSAYPAVMTQSLPFGKILNEPPKHNTFVELWALDIESADIKPEFNNCVFLKNWKGHGSGRRYLRHQADFRCYYFKEEFEWLMKFYDFKIKQIWVSFMATKHLTKHYVEELYNARLEFKKAGKDAFVKSIKILLNAGYGCLAKRPLYSDFIYYQNEYDNLQRGDIINIGGNEYIFNYYSDAFPIGNNYKCINATPDFDPFWANNLAAGAYITSLQRCELLKVIYDVAPKKFAYCDTDSIVFINLNEIELSKLNNYLGDGLGQWKIENKDAKYLWIRGAKRYFLLDATKEVLYGRFSGVGRRGYNLNDIIQYDWTQEEIHLEDCSFRPKRVKSGIVLEKIPKDIKKGEL